MTTWGARHCPHRGRPNCREPSVPSAAFAIAEGCTPDARLRPQERRPERPKAALLLRSPRGYAWGITSAENRDTPKRGAGYRWGTAARTGVSSTADTPRRLSASN